MWFPLALALLLAGHGYRKGSLSGSGAVAALTFGFATMHNPSAVFGIMLIVFYLTGSRATKVKADIKATLELETGHEESVKRAASASSAITEQKHKSASGGQRDAWQVICNALSGTIGAVVFAQLYAGAQGSRTFTLWISQTPNSVSKSLFCLLDSGSNASPLLDDPRTWVLFSLGHFACCMGDTLASELGILAKGQPRLVTTWKQVPRGTNGGVSALGTLVSLLGGALIGATCVASLYYLPPSDLDPSLCSPSASSALLFLSVAALSGLGGSMIDSVLGATVQRSWYNRNLGKVLVGGRPPSTSAAGAWQVITGRDLLSNNTVNFVSSVLTACLAAGLGRSLF